MSIRAKLDIERLVTWALRDQGLGWDAPVTAQDLFDIRREISNMRRRQDNLEAEPRVLEQPPRPALPRPSDR